MQIREKLVLQEPLIVSLGTSSKMRNRWIRILVPWELGAEEFMCCFFSLRDVEGVTL
jgi:hypothetical protein